MTFTLDIDSKDMTAIENLFGTSKGSEGYSVKYALNVMAVLARSGAISETLVNYAKNKGSEKTEQSNSLNTSAPATDNNFVNRRLEILNSDFSEIDGQSENNSEIERRLAVLNGLI